MPSLGQHQLSGEQVKQMNLVDLQTLAPVQQARTAAENKLAGYRETLQELYGSQLRLRVYSVVAVGDERLLWWELP